MFSMPPATATLMLPSAISCAAETIACAPEPHTRLTASAGVVTGSPACTAAWRAGFILLPAWMTLPMTTVSTSSGRIPARATAPLIAVAPRLAAGTSFNVPPNVPIAVRTGSANTTECCEFMASSPSLVRITPGSHLGKPAIHEQLRPGDVARVVGGEENDRFGDLVGRAEAAERYGGRDRLAALLAHLGRREQVVEPGRVDRPGAHRIDA